MTLLGVFTLAEIEAVATQYPGPIEVSLRPPSRWLVATRIVAVMLVLVLPGIVAIINATTSGNAGGAAVGAALSAIGILAVGTALDRWNAAWPLIPILVLDRDGFTMSNGLVRRTARWDEVDDFRVQGVIFWPRVWFKNTARTARWGVRLGL